MKAPILLTTLGACLLGLSAGASADPAVYRDNQLVIPSGALINANRQQYYSNVILSTDAEGKLKIVAATPLPPVYVDSVIPAVTENDDLRSVKVTIAGNKSVPCVALQDVAVSYKAGVFTLLLAESVQGPEESCIAVLDPFEVEVALDVSALPAGTYEVIANGEEASFVLTTNP